MKDTTLPRLGGMAAIGVAVLSIIYAIAYLVITPAAQRGPDPAAYYASFAANPTGRQLANLCFVVSGILGTFAVAAVADRLRNAGEGWARWLLGVGIVAMLATSAHGMWNFVLTPRLAGLYAGGDAATRAAIAVLDAAPQPADPSEFFTFAITGLWALVVGALILRGAAFPRWLGYVALVAGIDMLALFLADLAGAQTLILLTGGPASLILGPAMWAGLGLTLLRETSPVVPVPAPAAGA